jgi:hypothetical protein
VDKARSLDKYLATNSQAIPFVSIMGRKDGKWSKCLCFLGKKMSTGWYGGLWSNIIIDAVINLISVVNGSQVLLQCVQLD